MNRLIAGLFFCIFALVATAEPIPVSAFANLPEHSGVAMSPGGRYVAAKLFSGGQYVLVIYDLDNLGKAVPVILNPESMEVNWIHWKRDERLLVSVWFTSRISGIPFIGTRLVAMNADGSDMKVLAAPRRHEYLPVQIGDRVVDFLPRDPQHI